MKFTQRLIAVGWLSLIGLLAACGLGTSTLVATPAPVTPTAIDTSAPAGQGAPPPTSTILPSATPDTQGIPVFKHIFVIVLENKEKIHVIGNATAPYFNQLAQQYASAANFYAIRHPSLPNYLALTGGDTFNVTSDCTGCFRDVDNLASQLDAAGRSWKAYMESMPGPCFVGDAPPLYEQKHNPFIYFDAVRNNPTLCNQIVPLTDFAVDLQTGSVPDFVWITPNMCNDMHDCPVRTGDAWLQTWVPPILGSQAWQDQGVLFIVFDEGDTAAGCCTYAQGGNVASLVISPLAKPGFVSPVPYDHYSLLRTIEVAWGLPLLGQAACDCTPLMADFFATP
jgi:phosphatidylinositol-3-phosphatase